MESREAEVAGPSSSMPERTSTSALVALVACKVMLLLMVAA